MIKKVLLSTAVLGTFAAYAVHLKLDEDEHPVVAIKSGVTVLPTETPTPTSTPANTLNTPAPTLAPVPRGKYKDGAFTGPVTDAFYGPMQVKVVISGGKIVDVQFLQYPNDRRTSLEINQQAMPFLKQEAIIAQSAKVDGVSGATQTSKAFIESLNSALKQAS